MTGTVLDGNIDIAALQTDGTTIDAFGPWRLARYTDHVRDLIGRAVAVAADWQFSGSEPEIFAQAERALTLAQAEAVAAFLQEEGLRRAQVAAIGFHGQTVLHRPPARTLDGAIVAGATRQLGEGALMATRLGIPVVWDLRSADMAAGGQGAPLAPCYHAGLLSKAGLGRESAVLNLGGVANLSWWDGAEPHGFDTGPANAPVNDWVKRHAGLEMDRDGIVAARGTVDEERLAHLLTHPFFDAPYPKSLDRNSFTHTMADGLSLEDGAATLTAFSAGAVGRALDHLPQRPVRLVVCGGGRHNPTLLRELAKRTNCQVEKAEAHGWRGDAIEAELFAFLAKRRLRNLPISFPTTTGVETPQMGGRLALP